MASYPSFKIESTMKSVFISHSWHDKALARQIADVLTRLGGHVWLDEAEIKLGDSLISKIRVGIDSVDYVIALISERSASSEWVSKELDIAMNQEIEGRSLKVLPILAGKCTLPGFLLGKLYADMSTQRAFKTSLPMLLDRLEAPPNAVLRARRGEPLGLSTDGRWLRDLAAGLDSSDLSKRYRALKAAQTWRAEDLLDNLGTLEKIFNLLDPSNPTHFRVRALHLIGGIKDATFSYRVTPLLSDSNPHIVGASMDCLAGLKAEDAAPQILDAFERTTVPYIRAKCLQFFSRVQVESRSIVLTFAGICNKLMDDRQDDEGLKISILKAYVRQLRRGDEISLFNRVVGELGQGSVAVRLGVLESICEMGDDVWIIDGPHLRSRLARALIECGQSTVPRIAAASWLAIMLLGNLSVELSDRDMFWALVHKGDQNAVECWFEKLIEYRLDQIFDHQADVDGLASLWGKHNSSIDDTVCNAIVDIGNSDGMKFLSKINFCPDPWRGSLVLRALANIEIWDNSLDNLLYSVCRSVRIDARNEDVAWALICEYKAGKTDLNSLLDQFPRSLNETHLHAEKDRRQICAFLKDFRSAADSKARRRLANIIGRLNA
jgi:hypothetical protein